MSVNAVLFFTQMLTITN